MIVKELQIDGFRCLCDFALKFDEKLTVIVGENDSGKTSIIDAINLFIGEYVLEEADFNYAKTAMKISLVTEDFEFVKEFKKENLREVKSSMKPTLKYVQENKAYIEALDEGNLSTEEDKIKNLARQLGLAVRANSRLDNLKSSILEKFNEAPLVLEGVSFPKMNLIELNGKQFEDIDQFFREVFLKDKEAEIWNEKLVGDQTIKQIIENKLNEYSLSIARDLQDKGIKDKIKIYLKNLTEIKVEPKFEPRSLNISSRVKFLENGNDIPVDKKGDGTKRRISLALLEYKVESEQECENQKLYILDEPDTHLHVKAQLELFLILKELSDKGCQVILTTHSPFLINATKPKQIRLLYQPEINVTKLKFLNGNPDVADKILRQLGIENIYLYFAKKIVLVEGESEEAFFPRIYEKLYGTTLNNDFIKLINTRGICNIPGFSRALLELIASEKVYMVKDNDAGPETQELIAELNIPLERQLTIGSKEFEDAFSDAVLSNAWRDYLVQSGKDLSRSQWTEQNIAAKRGMCQQDITKKFSDEIKSLNTDGKKFTKSIFGQVLGNYCDASNLPEEIKAFLDQLKAT